MTLLGLIAVLVVVGVLLWAVSTFPAIDPTIKQILRVIIIVATVFWVLAALGVLSGTPLKVR